MNRHITMIAAIALLVLAVSSLFLSSPVHAADPIPGISIDIGSSGDTNAASSTLTILLFITILSLAPAILVLMTSFTRIVIVLGFVRTSLATQQMPPNQVLIGLALFMTLFIMSPTISQINSQAVQPYLSGQMDQTTALAEAAKPMKQFMIKHTREKDLMLFLEYTRAERPTSVEDISLTVLVPAYAISEMKTAFQIGFMIFIPFLVIDMIIASTLMAMGMMMLPPVMISLPFKILLFILVDGWYLVVKSLLLSFNP
jgi:flagellar biosynthesis protein FliP